MVDLMIHGVNQDKFALSNVFFVLEFVFETLTVALAEEFWQVMESRAESLTADLHRGKSPGIMLIRLLNNLTKRLDPYIHTSFRSRVQLFYFQAFGSESTIDPQTNDTAPLAIIEDSETGDSGTFLAVQKALADMSATTESEEHLDAFLTNIEKLEELFKNQQEMYRSEYSEIILKPELLELQLRDHSFQYKVSVQILLFIEALLQLRPSEIETLNAKKSTKHLVWSNLVLSADLVAKIYQAKRAWFTRLKTAATPEQLETVRLIITHEKESTAALLSDQQAPERGTEVNFTSNIAPKTRQKHFHNMGNMQLTNLWKEPLGIESFSAAKDEVREQPPGFYDLGNSLEGEAREGARWMSLFLQRSSNWNSFNTGAPPSIGPLFGFDASPRSPVHDSSFARDSVQGTPRTINDENLNTPSQANDRQDSIRDKEAIVDAPSDHGVADRERSADSDGNDKKRDLAPAESEPSPKRARKE